MLLTMVRLRGTHVACRSWDWDWELGSRGEKGINVGAGEKKKTSGLMGGRRSVAGWMEADRHAVASFVIQLEEPQVLRNFAPQETRHFSCRKKVLLVYHACGLRCSVFVLVVLHC